MSEQQEGLSQHLRQPYRELKDGNLRFCVIETNRGPVGWYEGMGRIVWASPEEIRRRYPFTTEKKGRDL